MPYFSHADFVEAEKKGDLIVPGRLDFGPISLDIRIAELLKVKWVQHPGDDINSLSNEQFVEKYTEPVELADGVWEVEPYNWLLWKPVEEIELAAGLMGDIVSRSSWARLGIKTSAKDVDAFIMKQPHKRRRMRPLCSLVTDGTKVKIRPEDPIAQMFVMDSPTFLVPEQVMALVDNDEFIVEQYGKRLKPEDLTFHGGLVLTMAPDIRVYNEENVLDLRDQKEDDFKTVVLSKDVGRMMEKRKFFLSTSEQYLKIPPGFIAEVSEGLSLMTACAYSKTFNPEYGPMPFRSHTNSPYVAPIPVFEGKVVFENSMIMDDMLIAGMKQTELYLHPLITPCDYTKESRYYGQQQTQDSQAHLDDEQ